MQHFRRFAPRRRSIYTVRVVFELAFRNCKLETRTSVRYTAFWATRKADGAGSLVQKPVYYDRLRPPEAQKCGTWNE